MAAVILLQSSPKQTAKQPWPPVLSRLQLWKMPLQRESVGEYLWDPKSKWVLAETSLYAAIFMKYLLLWPPWPREVVYLCSHHCWEEQYFCTERCRMQQSWDSSLSCDCCPTGTGGGGWICSRPSPDPPWGWWHLKGTCQAEWWSVGAGCWGRGSTHLFWSPPRCVSPAQVTSAALPLKGMVTSGICSPLEWCGHRSQTPAPFEHWSATLRSIPWILQQPQYPIMR